MGRPIGAARDGCGGGLLISISLHRICECNVQRATEIAGPTFEYSSINAISVAVIKLKATGVAPV